MPLTQYETYKDSGIQWLGEIPEHWVVKRIKDILESDVYGTSVSSNESGMYEILAMGDIDNGMINFPERRFQDEIPEGLILRKGDLLLNRTNSIALVGKVGLFVSDRKNVSFASYLIRLRLRQKFNNPQYFNYLLNSSIFIGYVRGLATQTANQANLNSSRYRIVEIPYFTISEQTTIAQYLDQKTTTIDRKISLLEQKISTYQNLRKSLINETVCRGLDKSVPLKDSGIEWIGQIPAHWDVRRGKDIFTEKSRKGYPNEPLLAASQKMGVVFKSMLEMRSMEAQKDFENFKLVQVGDFVISLRSFEGGIEIAYYRGIISPAYSVFSADKLLYVEYYKHLLKSEAFITNLQTLITGIRDGQTIKFSEVQKTSFPLPSRNEQTVIANYLDEKTRKIDDIIKNLKDQIETLKEFRKTLINDVVTGKIRVAETAETVSMEA